MALDADRPRDGCGKRTSMVHQSATAIEDLAQPFTLQMAIIIFTIIPILCVYPFVQKYFMKGMLMGSVKG